MTSLFNHPTITASIGTCPLGPAPVKVISSIMAANASDLLEQAHEYDKLDIDVIEWRADYFEQLTAQAFVSAAMQLKSEVSKPILWTLRTNTEGGQVEIKNEAYLELLELMAGSGLVDAIDVELAKGESASVIQTARASNTCVVMSNHDFEGTPELETIVARLLTMDKAGADILKIADMPHTPEDVLTLLAATTATRRRTAKPIISMAMGSIGTISRITGELFGSCATFASARQSSAPGQLPVSCVRDMLEKLKP